MLDAVPVRDQVQSSNVVAFPPDGDEPQVVVTVPYDTPEEGAPNGAEIGLFLELARALYAAAPEHAVGFAAVGAEGAEGRGSAALAGLFEEQGIEPGVISIRPSARAGESLSVTGSCMDPDSQLVAFEECSHPTRSGSPFAARGLQFTAVGGDVDVLGRALFDFLLGVPD